MCKQSLAHMSSASAAASGLAVLRAEMRCLAAATLLLPSRPAVADSPAAEGAMVRFPPLTAGEIGEAALLPPPPPPSPAS